MRLFDQNSQPMMLSINKEGKLFLKVYAQHIPVLVQADGLGVVEPQLLASMPDEERPKHTIRRAIGGVFFVFALVQSLRAPRCSCHCWWWQWGLGGQ